ncbi:hypothetical protein RJ639_037335 [Escallonia herrerae]|uniref:Zinc finger, CCHC-type n=1 Tax=Escallonia herrerae TaxID=1293975 RepID=A0AA88WRY5_9ASTE|nr:hypothetical protein RJ639_037335 [Escallonia herrerae]
MDAWKHSDFLCKNYILNGLDNALYNVYSPMVNAKALWESLERKYKTEDAGSKKFVVGKFLDFKMVDSKTVISQVQEFQLILHDIHAEGMVLGESFQVAALIEKLPPTWKDFKNYLKHKHKEMKLEDLIVRLRIEEDNRQSEKKAGNYHQEAKANVVEQVAAMDAWKHSDFLCKNYILNGLDNALYNVYSPMVNAKALWESLERKYKTEDAGSKKFVVGKFLDFKMVDSKTVISQVQEFQLILHDIHAEGMVLGESFQVAALIEKLPPTWKDFKNYLKHKHKEMKLEDLIVRLRIEEDNRQSEKKAGNYHQEAKANVVEQGLWCNHGASEGLLQPWGTVFAFE